MNNWPEKKLGFGLMRLPKLADGSFDMEQVCQMADAFLANGFTYFDTAFVYEGSEEAFRKAVVERHPRESFTIASKLAGWRLKEGFGPEEMLAETMSRMGVDYIDYYLLHSLQETHGTIYEDNGCWEFITRKKEEGVLKHIGFSFHGSPEYLEQLLQLHPEVEFVQLQINYADWDNASICSRRNYEICEKYGKSVIVMEPAKGGLLANVIPEARKVFDEADPNASSASFALRYAASLPAVKVVLSGMSLMSQMEDNLNIFADFKPLSDAEKEIVNRAANVILSSKTVPCTSCRYCVDGCPMGITIPRVFTFYNMLQSFGEHQRPHSLYKELVEGGSGRAADCIQCGQCESVCPQHISIIEKLQDASAVLDV